MSLQPLREKQSLKTREAEKVRVYEENLNMTASIPQVKILFVSCYLLTEISNYLKEK